MVDVSLPLKSEISTPISVWEVVSHLRLGLAIPEIPKPIFALSFPFQG